MEPTVTGRPGRGRHGLLVAGVAAVLGLGAVGALAAAAQPEAVVTTAGQSSGVSRASGEDQSGKEAQASAEALARKDARHAAELQAQAERARAGADQASDWPRGIFDDAEAPARGAKFVGTNRWVGGGGDGTLAVWAGRAGEDATVGRVLVGVFGTDGEAVSRDTVDLPGTGALRIVSADGVVLRLVDEAGRHHRLDAATGGFL